MFQASSSSYHGCRTAIFRVDRLVLVALVAISFLPCASAEEAAPAAQPCGQRVCRPGDELWFVSTRHLGWPDCRAKAPPDLRVLRYDCQKGWQNARLADLERKPHAQQLTVVHVHGYWCEYEASFTKGLAF